MDFKTIKIICSIALLCILPFVGTAQTAVPQSLTKTLVTFSFFEKDNLSLLTDEYIKDLKKTSSIPLEASVYKALIKNGVHYDEKEDRIYLNTLYDDKFSKVEIIQKYTNDHVFSHKFNDQWVEKEFQDLSSGTYLIILTNDSGNVNVEEITIFQRNEEEAEFLTKH